MMGGAGHIQDMIHKVKQNRALKSSQKRDLKKQFGRKGDTSELEFVKVSETELEQIKQKNRLKAKKERIKKHVMTLLIFIPLFILIMYYLKKSLFMTLK
ncbi:hypothetical protein Q4595_04555 [Wenyingzhuangia sp. 1_MG-2023]|nr:hypothetical protein [Wenyingzhuangia sp. 1_MG-2023]